MFMMITTFLDVKGLQSSNRINYAQKLSYLVKRITVTSLYDADFNLYQGSNGMNYSKLCMFHGYKVGQRSLMKINDDI